MIYYNIIYLLMMNMAASASRSTAATAARTMVEISSVLSSSPESERSSYRVYFPFGVGSVTILPKSSYLPYSPLLKQKRPIRHPGLGKLHMESN